MQNFFSFLFEKRYDLYIDQDSIAYTQVFVVVALPI